MPYLLHILVFLRYKISQHLKRIYSFRKETKCYWICCYSCDNLVRCNTWNWRKHFTFGIQTWFIFSFPYYIFAIIYAFWIAPRIKKSGALSIPEQFKTHYGDSAGLAAALIISFLSNPAPYILSLGILLEFLFGISLGVSLAIATLFSVLYIWNGGVFCRCKN